MKLETDVLVVGAGPAGLTAALALSSYGVKTTIITRHRWLAHTPRAHVTNQRTFEVFRDLGIETEARARATDYSTAPDVVYCASLTGEEYARWRAFGTGQLRVGDYCGASPCRHADLAQNILEPILLSNSLARGADVRFNTDYVSHTQDQNGVRAILLDRSSGQTFEVAAQFLIGADGANSKIAQDLELPMEGLGGIGHSINLFFEAELASYVEYRPAFLYTMITRPRGPEDLGLAVLRPTRHWNEWLLTPGYTLATGRSELTEEAAIAIIRDCTGIADLVVRLKAIDPWEMNSLRATEYSKGRVFCVGDAVHRHPPTNGLGSNTAVQDAYNLAWKLAFVLQGKADVSLLLSYGEERVPVGKQVVERATKSLGIYAPIIQALHLNTTGGTGCVSSPEQEFTDEQQRQLHKAIAGDQYNMNSHGVEMNHCYNSSAIIPDGTPAPSFTRDRDLYYVPSTRPGSHLPHAWIQRHGSCASTLDLVGKGRFTLVTGLGGEVWVEAAAFAAQSLSLMIESYAIGPHLDLTDLYGEWEALRGMSASGCLLIRPDGYICLRQQGAKNQEDAKQCILKALKTILGRSN